MRVWAESPSAFGAYDCDNQTSLDKPDEDQKRQSHGHVASRAGAVYPRQPRVRGGEVYDRVLPDSCVGVPRVLPASEVRSGELLTVHVILISNGVMASPKHLRHNSHALLSIFQDPVLSPPFLALIKNEDAPEYQRETQRN